MLHGCTSKLAYSIINQSTKFYAYKSWKENYKENSFKYLPRKNATQILFYLIKSVRFTDLLKCMLIVAETEI